jgi:hypothetical protein
MGGGEGMNMKKGKHPTSNIEQPTSNGASSAVWEFNEGGNGNRKFDLEERLLEFASAIIDLSESLPDSPLWHIAIPKSRRSRGR